MAISYSLGATNNDTIVIDRTRATDPISATLLLVIQNQGTSTMYYKITETSGAWSISSPTDGKLGSVNSGYKSGRKITLQRALPTSDTIETVTFTLEAYSDSGYTNLVESTTFSITFVIADIHSWPSYTKYDFDDGTSQGWSFNPSSYMTVSASKSITAGGYSVALTGSAYRQYTLTKSETLPSNSRVVMMLYYNVGSEYSTRKLHYIAIKVNGNTVFQAGVYDLPQVSTSGFIATDYTTTWDMIGVDLSDYAGQSVTIDIVVSAEGGYTYLDDIIIAGTDAL